MFFRSVFLAVLCVAGPVHGELGVNPVKISIQEKDTSAFGGFLTIADGKVVENMALAGKLDFMWIEAEHTEFDPGDVQQLCRVIENEGLVPIVRVPANDPNLIKKYVGTGVAGVVVPSIQGPGDARAGAGRRTGRGQRPPLPPSRPETRRSRAKQSIPRSFQGSPGQWKQGHARHHHDRDQGGRDEHRGDREGPRN